MAKTFTKSELAAIKKYNSPRRVQQFLNSIPYNFKDTFWPFRKVIRNRTANCFEGALTAAAILSQHGYPPLVVCMEAKDDLDHNIFVYRKNNRWGSVATSRDKELRGRPPAFKSPRALVMSYYAYYYNSYTHNRNDLTLRGFSGPINMSRFKEEWVTTERNLRFFEDYLYKIAYRKLFPTKKELYKGFPHAEKKNYYYSPRGV